MKTFILSILASLTLATSAFAGAGLVWQCTDAASTIEGAGISEYRGRTFGGISWDCWPGGGICNERALVTVIRNSVGDLVYRSPHFLLVVHVSAPPVNGEFDAHLIATDEDDPKTLGRGLPFNEYVKCTAAK